MLRLCTALSGLHNQGDAPHAHYPSPILSAMRPVASSNGHARSYELTMAFWISVRFSNVHLFCQRDKGCSSRCAMCDCCTGPATSTCKYRTRTDEPHQGSVNFFRSWVVIGLLQVDVEMSSGPLPYFQNLPSDHHLRAKTLPPPRHHTHTAYT